MPKHQPNDDEPLQVFSKTRIYRAFSKEKEEATKTFGKTKKRKDSGHRGLFLSVKFSGAVKDTSLKYEVKRKR